MADQLPVTEHIVALLRSRAEHGQQKYGTTLDRKDMTRDQWAQHMLEELLDGAGYLVAMMRDNDWVAIAAELLRADVVEIKTWTCRGGAPELGQQHVISMLERIARREITGHKAHRWLGWAQAAIVASGNASLDDMKEINRIASGSLD